MATGHCAERATAAAMEPTRAVVGVDALALGGRLQVPARAEEPLAGPGEDGDAELRVTAEPVEGGVQRPAGRNVDRVGLGPGQGDDQDRSVRSYLYVHDSHAP